MRRDVVKMTNPIVVAFVVLDRDLSKAISGLRTAIARIRRRACMGNVSSGSGAIEAKTTVRGHWSAHCHLVIDVDGELQLDTISAAWHALVSGHGAVVLHGTPELQNADAATRYACKAEGFCPPPARMSLDELDELRTALKGRRLPIRWGLTT